MSVGGGLEKLKPSHAAAGTIQWDSHFRKSLEVS